MGMKLCPPAHQRIHPGGGRALQGGFSSGQYVRGGRAGPAVHQGAISMRRSQTLLSTFCIIAYRELGSIPGPGVGEGRERVGGGIGEKLSDLEFFSPPELLRAHLYHTNLRILRPGHRHPLTTQVLSVGVRSLN